ncbi:MAG: class II aldolase/adducin family protein [Rhodococcus sp. (in: high G+C Gram-positive bacteria)]
MTPDYTAERMAVLATQHRCREQGLQSGNGGNVSVRIPGAELMAAKASNASFADSSVDAAVVADFSGRLVVGSRPPTKEALLHGSIYARMPEVGAVVHCHSPWAIACAAKWKQIPASTYHAVLKLGGPVPVIDTGGYSVRPEQVDEVLAAFSGPPEVRAIMLAGHGLVAVGRDLDDAVCTAELVEETAHVAAIADLLTSADGR